MMRGRSGFGGRRSSLIDCYSPSSLMSSGSSTPFRSHSTENLSLLASPYYDAGPGFPGKGSILLTMNNKFLKDF
jgi:hypothetical protein